MNAYNLVHGYLPGRVFKEFQNKNYLIGALDATYEQPKRYYHNLSHISGMLLKADDLERSVNGLKFSNELYAAILFHDIVYDVKAERGVNERYSAIMAEQLLTKCAHRDSFDIPKVCNLVECTVHGRDLSESGTEEQVIADLDLANFVRYVDLTHATYKVIQEYETAYPKEAVFKGRIDFLTKMESEPAIFFSPYYLPFTEQARENIRLEIQALKLG